MFESLPETNCDPRPPGGFASRAHEYSPLDLQYEICTKYVKHTAEQLYQQELNLIQQSAKLV